MTAVDAKQHQATWQDGSSAGTEFGAAGSQLKPRASGLHLPPKVPAGVSVVGAKPREPLPEAGPLHLPSGAEQPVSSHMLQLDAQAGQIVAAAPLAQPAGAPSAQAVALRIKEALKATDYLQALGKAYAARPDEQQLMREDPTFRLVIADTAKTATKGLTDIDAAPLPGPAAQARSDTAIENLRQTLQQLDPAFAGLVAKEAVPTFQQFYQANRNMPNGSGFGPPGITALVWLTDRIAGTTQGNDAITGFLTLNAWDASAVRAAMAHGASNAYAIAYARSAEAAANDTSFVLRSLEEVSLPETRVALQSAAAKAVRALAENDAEMAWLAQNVCGPLGSELLPTAKGRPSSFAQMGMDGYLASKNWEEKLHSENLRNQEANDGVKLLKHMIALNKIARDAGLAPSMQEQLVALAQDPAAFLAIQTAIEKYPELTEEGGEGVAELVETLRNDRPSTWGDNSASRFALTPAGKERLVLLTALAAKLANVAVTALVRNRVLNKIANLDLADPASVARVTAAIKGLRSDRALARLLTVSEAKLNWVVRLINQGVVRIAQSVADMPAWLALFPTACLDLDSELDKIGSGKTARIFSQETEAGKFLRSQFGELPHMEWDLSHPEGRWQAIVYIGALERHPVFRGLPPSEVHDAIELLMQAVSKPGLLAAEVPASLVRSLAFMEVAGDELWKIGLEIRMDDAFATSSLAGQAMRGVAAVVMGLSFVNSFKALMDKPDVVKGLKTADLGLMASQEISAMLVSLGVFGPTSAVGGFANAVIGGVPLGAVGEELGLGAGAKFGGIRLSRISLPVYAALEAVDSVRSAFGIWGSSQDTGAAILSGMSAVGFGLTAMPEAIGAASWTGPVGMAIVAASIAGEKIYHGVKDAHKYEPASNICLQAAGFNAAAAAKLSRQANYLSAVPGMSQVSFLGKYARYRGMTMVALRDWINKLTPEQVGALSDNVLYALNEGMSDPTRHRQQWVGAGLQDKSPVPKVSPEEVAKRLETLEMSVFESGLMRDKVLDADKAKSPSFGPSYK